MKKADITYGTNMANGRKSLHAVAAFMSIVVLCVLLLSAFHHHDDVSDHDSDCSICSVLNHRTADVVPPVPGLNYLPFVFASLLSAYISAFVFFRYYPSPQNRAPPVF